MYMCPLPVWPVSIWFKYTCTLISTPSYISKYVKITICVICIHNPDTVSVNWNFIIVASAFSRAQATSQGWVGHGALHGSASENWQGNESSIPICFFFGWGCGYNSTYRGYFNPSRLGHFVTSTFFSGLLAGFIFIFIISCLSISLRYTEKMNMLYEYAGIF